MAGIGGLYPAAGRRCTELLEGKTGAPFYMTVHFKNVHCILGNKHAEYLHDLIMCYSRCHSVLKKKKNESTQLMWSLCICTK